LNIFVAPSRVVNKLTSKAAIKVITHHEEPSAAQPQPKKKFTRKERKRRKENPPFIPVWQRGKEGDLLVPARGEERGEGTFVLFASFVVKIFPLLGRDF
jgi:hypothetical protein